jgi:5-methylcytosine-specific restriction endonuclease McrA
MPKPAKIHNGGQWTEARKTAFIKSALRGARWPVKYAVIREAYVKDGINPATGRTCKLHRCALCQGLFPQSHMRADHIIPVVGPEGFKDWNTFIARLYVEKDGFQAICKDCHKTKTKQENQERKRVK